MTENKPLENWRRVGSITLSVFFIIILLVTIIFALTEKSTELTPNHDAMIGSVVWAVGAGAAAVTLFLLVWLKSPIKEPRLLTVPGAAFAAALIAGGFTKELAENIWQMADFKGQGKFYERQFPIDHASVSHGRYGLHYHIILMKYMVYMKLSEEAYDQVFGGSEKVRPGDYCLYAPVEQNGPALRILYGSSHAIPSERIRRCDPNAIAAPSSS